MGSNHKTLDIIAQDASANSNVPSTVSAAPFAHLASKVPQLSEQKDGLKDAIRAHAFDETATGAVNHNMTKFRAAVSAKAVDQFISVAELKECFAAVNAPVNDIVFNPWMERLCSLKKGHAHLTALFESLRSTKIILHR